MKESRGFSLLHLLWKGARYRTMESRDGLRGLILFSIIFVLDREVNIEKHLQCVTVTFLFNFHILNTHLCEDKSSLRPTPMHIFSHVRIESQMPG